MRLRSGLRNGPKTGWDEKMKSRPAQSDLVDRGGVRTIFFVVGLASAFCAFASAQDRTIEIGRQSFAAIAYSPATGNYAYAYDYRSRAAAEKTALEKCDAQDGRIVCWVNKGFCALALGADKSCWGAGWSYGNGASNTKAKDYALEDCRKRTTDVRIAVALSSDGQYVWDSKEHTVVIDKNGNIRDGYGNLITPTPTP
jgi:Domain of unknown function (DUF4189)